MYTENETTGNRVLMQKLVELASSLQHSLATPNPMQQGVIQPNQQYGGNQFNPSRVSPALEAIQKTLQGLNNQCGGLPTPQLPWLNTGKMTL